MKTRFISLIIAAICSMNIMLLGEDIIPVCTENDHPDNKNLPKRMPSKHSPYVTIDDNDVLRVYGEYSDNVTVVVLKNNNMVWSGYPSSTNNQCQEFTITGLTKGISYTLYLNIDETTYIGNFVK
ncbi:hypothetical protein [Muribaculum gordoncarteri]|jgi:hypothetical protein|uniref:DUF3244 domain-containing protein n=4 Tax=Muribaculum TaxID=1918540 RepID=A0A4P7VQJ4_9BACT|nr:hypothetical protein [Muribaculum gordoncarteri]QCD36553.1 hypothetical protein E7746_12000 [Muribaculum gordoncarteri]